MSTSITVSFTAGVTGVTLTSNGHTRSNGLVAGGPTSDLKHRDPLAWVAMSEFEDNGATSGIITITAV